MKVVRATWVGLIVCLLATSAASAQVYKWKDADGKTHFGERPPNIENASKIKTPAHGVSSKPSVSANRPEIIIYTTSWCGYCKKAKAYFAANKMVYKEYDIEKDRFAKRAYDRIGGRGVPVILVGDQRLNGFSRERFDSIYELAKLSS